MRYSDYEFQKMGAELCERDDKRTAQEHARKRSGQMPELYLIEVNHFNGSTVVSRYFPERNTVDLTRAATVKEITSGEYEGVNRVLALDPDAGTSRDATKEIAQEILDAIDQPPPAFLENFLQEVLGVGTVNRVLREMENG